MKLIHKPDIEDWPNEVKMAVNGVPVLIDYEQDLVVIPDEAKDKEEHLARYLIDEGFIQTD